MVFKMKIGFAGAQGSGKTTKAYELAYELKRIGYDVYMLSEVARSCPLPINEEATTESQLWILGETLSKEQSCKGDILIHDRTLLDAYVYSMRINPKLFISLEPFIKEYMQTYDIIFYMGKNDSYLIDDGIRSTNKLFRDEIDRLILDYIKKLKLKVVQEEDVIMYTLDNIN